MLSALLFVALAPFAGPNSESAGSGETLMARLDRYDRLRNQISQSVKRGEIVPTWADDSESFTYVRDNKTYRFDVAKRVAELQEGTPPAPRRRRPTAPDRGRQNPSVTSPDGKLRAVTRDGNVFLETDGKAAKPLTTDGGKNRVKYGIASWVYGEELGVRDAMWFSPDGKFLAYYRFDESEVKDYFLALDVAKVQNRLDVEAYPKAGTANPKVELRITEIATLNTVIVEGGFGDPTLGEYLYAVRWSPKGEALLFNRTNRKQNVMQLCAADPATGKARTIVEERATTWTDNSPECTFLKDGQRFVWATEGNGFRNLELRNLDGKRLATLTNHGFDVERSLRVDEECGEVWYLARSGSTPYHLQVHRVGLDGKNDRRLTDPDLHHNAWVSPNAGHFVIVRQTREQAPTTVLCDRDGRELARVAESDLTAYAEMKLRPVETFRFLAADGKTECFGNLHRPRDFDPAKRYPLMVGVYAGPESGGDGERFLTPDGLTELGFLVATFDGRGTNGRGKAFRDAVYGKLGIVEIDDQAAGVRALATRPYVDGKRVGIHGTSYGGYATVMALLRHADVFHAGVASSSVTAWENYDTIYTERYMGLPWKGENDAGYAAGSAMPLAANLKGRLLLYYGTADNNVHPANTYQLVQALQRARKRFDVLPGPDLGHVGAPPRVTAAFFLEHLMGVRSADPVASALRRRSRAVS